MNRAAAILVLVLLAAFGASPRAQAKVCVREKTASGDFSSRHALHARTSAPRAAESQWVGGGEATNFASDRSIGLNWYAYANGNPINFADPTGLETWQPSQSYQNQIRGNTEVMQLLQDRHAYVEDVSMANDIDSDLVRAIIIHESRGFGDRFQRLEAQVSWIRNGTAGSYGYAQLGPDARRASNLSIEEAQRMRGSISGAARWLSISQTNLVNRGVSNPSVAQVASQYNYARQDGLVSNYGRQVNWTHSQIQSGSIGSFHKTSSTPKK